MTSNPENLAYQIDKTREKLNNFIGDNNSFNSIDRHKLLRLSKKMDKLLVKYIKEAES